MIGSLLILLLVDFCIHVCYISSPKVSHLHAIKRINRYVEDTSSFGLFYPKNTSFDLIGYCDANFARNKVDRKSTSGTC